MFNTRANLCFATFLLAAALDGSTSQASVIVGLLMNPPTTAGGGATSTRSGPGSWQLYAIDNSSTDFGISSYNINISGTTAINHRSPRTTINDSNGDPQNAGFTLLRTATNINPIQAAQSVEGFPGSTPFLITGFGQTASDFTTKATAIDAGAVVVGPTTSGGWGNYDSPALTVAGLNSFGATAAAAAVAAGKKWVFLAEGLGFNPQITSAVVTVFNAQGGSVATPTQIVNLPLYPTLVIDNVNANDPGMVTRDLSPFYPGPPPNQFWFLGGPSLAHPATLDPTTKEFRWNTTGAILGEYSWHTAYLTDSGDWNPHLDITVRITAVPEPAACSLAGLSFFCHLCLIRRRTISRHVVL